MDQQQLAHGDDVASVATQPGKLGTRCSFVAAIPITRMGSSANQSYLPTTNNPPLYFP
jgi:hypothetical protein